MSSTKLTHKAKSRTFFVTSFSVPFTKEAIKAPNKGKIIIEDNMGKAVKIKSQYLMNKILTKIIIPVNIITA